MSILSLTLPADGETIDASDVNAPFNDIAALLNGKLDDQNIKELSGTKILDGTLKYSAFNTSLQTLISGGWTELGTIPTVSSVYGNNSFELTFTGVDYRDRLSKRMRFKGARNAAVQTQYAALNGTNQYFNRSTTITGMSFTNNFTVGAWIYLTSYQAGTIISRYNGTSGWSLDLTPTGQLRLIGVNGGAANFSQILSTQSPPLNKWVQVTGQLDMLSFTVSPTTSYLMMDGVDVSAAVSRGGNNPTALVQAGNLEVGSANAATFFPGRIAQAFVTSTKTTQANVRNFIYSGITSGAISSYSIVSAFSGDGNMNDLNTTNANNLSAQNTASYASTGDLPFNSNAMCILMTDPVFSGGNTTVKVSTARGYTLPNGTLNNAFFSATHDPLGFPSEPERWQIISNVMINVSTGIAGSGTWSTAPVNLTVPAGTWKVGYEGTYAQSSTVNGIRSGFVTMNDSAPTNAFYKYRLLTRLFTQASVANAIASDYKVDDRTVANATTFQMYGTMDSPSGTESWAIRGDQSVSVMFADNALL